MKKILFFVIVSPLLLSYVNVTAQNWVNGGNNLSATGRLGTTSNQSVAFITNNTERGRVNTAGNWGFGTTSPTERVHINGASGLNAFRVQINGSTKLLVHSGGGIAIGSPSAPPSNGLYVSGNVGIGTNSPSYKLHVVGGATVTQGLYVQDYGTSSYNYTGSYGTYSYGSYAGTYSYGPTYGIIGYGTATDATSYGVYGSGGTYGVYGTGHIGSYATSSSAGGDGFRSSVSGSANYGVNSYSANSYGIYASTGVSGGIAAYFVGSVYSTGTYQGSDAKLKKNVNNVDNAMNIINQLQPKNYEYRNDGNYAKMNLPQGTHYGFIAQDLEKVLPNLVKQTQFNVAKATPLAEAAHIAPQADGANGKTVAAQPTKAVKAETIDFKAVNYTELIPIIVKAMQEQEAKIEALTELVNQLRNAQPETSVKLTGALLSQNTPNPAAANTTRISYSLPSNSATAALMLTNAAGQTLKQIQLNRNGAGYVDVNTSALSPGTYFYTLIVNGKSLETKKMTVSKL